jgi:hypothetical protein
MKKTTTFDINQVKVIDLDGQLIPVNVAKTVGNVIYMKATTLEWDSIARAIYAGKEVEVSAHELAVMERLLLAPETPIYLMVKKPLKNYFKTLKKQS